MSFYKIVEDDLRALSVEARKNNLSRLGMVKEAAERAILKVRALNKLAKNGASKLCRHF